MYWVLEQLWKYNLYANLKKYRFYQNKLRFLEYIMSIQKVRIEDKKIKVVKK